MTTINATNNKEAVKSLVKNLKSPSSTGKYFDTVVSASPVDYSGSVWALTQVTAGTTDTTRIGDKIIPKKLQIRINCLQGDVTNDIRIIIFRWKVHTTFASPSISGTILQNVSTVDAPRSAYYHDFEPAFDVLYDKRFTLNTYDPVKDLDLEFKLPESKPIQMVAAGTNGINHLYMGIVSDSGAVVHPTLYYYSRVDFVDY
jgi:hypothetical protein